MDDTTPKGGQVHMDSCRGPTGTVPASRQARRRTLEDPRPHQMPTASIPVPTTGTRPRQELQRPQCDTARALGFTVVDSSLGGGQ